MNSSIHWLCHMKHWFGFDELAHFEFNRETGGYFANTKGIQIYSIIQAGQRKPKGEINDTSTSTESKDSV
jgi:hypothetical protein